MCVCEAELESVLRFCEVESESESGCELEPESRSASRSESKRELESEWIQSLFSSEALVCLRARVRLTAECLLSFSFLSFSFFLFFCVFLFFLLFKSLLFFFFFFFFLLFWSQSALHSTPSRRGRVRGKGVALPLLL